MSIPYFRTRSTASRRWRDFLVRALVLALLYPWIVGFDERNRESSSTTIGIDVGAGSYDIVRRDCSGNITGHVRDVGYADAALSVDHRLSEYISMKGVAGFFIDGAGGDMAYADGDIYQQFHPSAVTVIYVSPSLRLHTDWFGADAGVMVFSSPIDVGEKSVIPTGRLRFGRLDDWFVTADFGASTPFISGGIAGGGLGLALPGEGSTLWLGVTGGAHAGPLYTSKLDLQLDPTHTLRLGAGLTTEPTLQYTLTTGLAIRL